MMQIRPIGAAATPYVLAIDGQSDDGGNGGTLHIFIQRGATAAREQRDGQPDRDRGP